MPQRGSDLRAVSAPAAMARPGGSAVGRAIAFGSDFFFYAFFYAAISVEQRLVREHGAGAALEAAQRAEVMLERLDMDGCAVWKRTVAAVKEIQRLAPGERENVH